MASVSNSLTTDFVFNGSISPLNQYNKSYSSSLGLMAKGVGLAAAATGAMFALATSQLSVIDTMGQLSRETGTSVEFLQELGYTASVNGGSIESLQNSVRGLSEKIGEASINGSDDFNRLGISVRKANGDVKNTEEVLGEVRNSFRGLSKEQQVSFAQKLGIDKGLLQTLNLTNAELEKTRKIRQAFGTASQKDTDAVIKYNDSLTTSKMALSSLGQQISLQMLPSMQNLVTGFNDLLFGNVDLIKNGLSSTFFWLGSVSNAVANTGRAIYEGLDYFYGFENALMATGAAILYFNRSLLLNPVGLFIAGLAGAILIVDDLYNAFNGGQSVIKDFFASFNIDIVNTLSSVFDGMKITLNSLLIGLLAVGEALTTVVLLGAKAGNVIGLDIDTKGIEEFKKIQNSKRLSLSSENQRLSNDIGSRNYTTAQNVTVTQNISGTDPQRVAELSGQNIEGAITSANAQIGKGGR